MHIAGRFHCVYTTNRCLCTPNVLYNRIALFRADHGLSRRDLAEAVGVNPQTIGYLERGDYKPSLDLALRIAERFAVPVELIFSLTPSHRWPTPCVAKEPAHDEIRDPGRGRV
ncbi:helix-turn-helix transcriptional regulator [Sphingomonas hankookensis]|uniref:helix-turn-helix transcriptional regulator n=1 Tax=Sphingomonas hankookensis TaxID=563996 RepID=UPI003D303804